jgi:hypothetical protein
MNSKTEKIFDNTFTTSLNPYLSAAAMIVKRLSWDIHPWSWISRKKVKNWQNKYEGKKAIILCNGPSLNKVDFKLLQSCHIFTFGLNKINLLFERTDFRPSFIVSVNPFVIEQNKNFYNTTDIPIFLDSNSRKWVPLRKNIFFLHSAVSGMAGQFARDCSISINQGSTVTYVALQLAFHMGFYKVAIVGCDHNFKTKGPSNKKVQGNSEDPDHFDSRYFSSGMTWQLPDIAASELHYEKARDIYTHFGRKIVNCTMGGKLEVFERMPITFFLEE